MGKRKAEHPIGCSAFIVSSPERLSYEHLFPIPYVHTFSWSPHGLSQKVIVLSVSYDLIRWRDLLRNIIQVILFIQIKQAGGYPLLPPLQGVEL